MEILGCFFPFSPQFNRELTRTSLLPHFDLSGKEIECDLGDSGNSLLQDEMKALRQNRLFVNWTLIWFQTALGAWRLGCLWCTLKYERNDPTPVEKEVYSIHAAFSDSFYTPVMGKGFRLHRASCQVVTCLTNEMGDSLLPIAIIKMCFMLQLIVHHEGQSRQELTAKSRKQELKQRPWLQLGHVVIWGFKRPGQSFDHTQCSFSGPK